MSIRKRVYICGAYSGDNILEILDNMRKGMRVATELLIAGYAPFYPFTDYHYQLMRRNGDPELTLSDYYESSISWMSVSQAIFVLPTYKKSTGAKKEIMIANGVGKPLFFDIETLKKMMPPK